METKSVVAFIDILGFSEIVAANDKSQDNDIFNDLNNALNEALKKSIDIQKQLLKSVGEMMGEDIVGKFKHKQFSDNIYFSFDYQDESELDLAFFFVVSNSILYQRTMLSKGYYVRGGIAEGQNFVGENLIFSKALIKAYELESKWANYPRIIIDKPLIEKVKIHMSPLSVYLMVRLNRNIVKDWAEIVFINPFYSMINENPSTIISFNEMLVKNPAIVEKINQLPPDDTDQELLKRVRRNVEDKIIRHESESRIFEKYVWMQELIKWTLQEKSNLDFFEIRLSTTGITSLLQKKDEFSNPSSK